MISYYIFWVGMLLFSVFFLIKNERTCRMHDKIVDAITRYQLDIVEHYDWSLPDEPEFAVDFKDRESYDDTLWRLWDWGCTRILPPDKYEIIKPYL